MAIKNNITALAKNQKKAVKVPSKVTMNFARRESSFNWKKMLPTILVIVAFALLFAKFGFIDQTNKKIEAYSRLSEKQAQLAACNARLAEYDELFAKFGKYSYGWMTDTEVNTVDRMEILGLIEKYIMPRAGIEDFAISNNVLDLNLTGITLEQTSSMVKALEQDKLVESASVYNASAQDTEDPKVYISIILTNGTEAE